MKQNEHPPAGSVDLLDLAPAFNALVDITSAESLSLGINKHHLAIALRPAKGQAVGPARLRDVLEKSGVYPALFNRLMPQKGYAITSGSFGAYASTMIPTKLGPRWLKTEKQKTLHPRPWNLLTVLYEFLQVRVDIRLRSMLPHFIRKPVYLNGFRIEPAISTVRDREQHREPVSFDWQLDEARGVIYHNASIPFGIVVHEWQVHRLEDWSNFVVVIEEGEVSRDHLNDLMIRISRHLRGKLIATEFVPNQTVEKSQIEKYATDERLLRFLASEEVSADLFRLLGFGIREQNRGYDPAFIDGFDTSALRVIADPVLPADVSRAAVVLLPEEINLVDQHSIYPGYPGTPVRVTTRRRFQQTGDSPLNTNLVDEIKVGELTLPYIYLEEESQIYVNDKLLQIGHHPTLLLVQGERSLLEVFLYLAASPLLMEGILINLLARGEDIWESFDGAIPEEPAARYGFEFDHELAAAAFLSKSTEFDREEDAFLKRLTGWLQESSLCIPLEDRDEAELVCLSEDCIHATMRDCMQNAREALIAHLLELAAADPSLQDDAQYKAPINWAPVVEEKTEAEYAIPT